MDKTHCAYCGKESEYILVDCEDGSSVAFCSWECNMKFLSTRITEPIEYPKPKNVDDHCSVCGVDVVEEDCCEDCLDTAFVLLKAIMKATHIDDLAVAWITWRNGWPPKPESKQFMGNCLTCGKVLWIKRWERQEDKRIGRFCSTKYAAAHETKKVGESK